MANEMSDFGFVSTSNEEKVVTPVTTPASGADLQKLKEDLQGYKKVILPLSKFLEWEQNYYAAIVIGLVTFTFALIWYMEPSVLTTFSLIGVIVCVVDFVVPTVSSYLFESAEWSPVEEKKFENICQRLLNFKIHMSDAWTTMMELKNEKPKVYLMMMMGIFALLAWFGSLIDNLLLTYLLVVFVMCVPGLRRHGILQKVTSRVSEFIRKKAKSVKEKTEKALKEKTK